MAHQLKLSIDSNLADVSLVGVAVSSVSPCNAVTSRPSIKKLSGSRCVSATRTNCASRFGAVVSEDGKFDGM